MQTRETATPPRPAFQSNESVSSSGSVFPHQHLCVPKEVKSQYRHGYSGSSHNRINCTALPIHKQTLQLGMAIISSKIIYQDSIDKMYYSRSAHRGKYSDKNLGIPYSNQVQDQQANHILEDNSTITQRPPVTITTSNTIMQVSSARLNPELA